MDVLPLPEPGHRGWLVRTGRRALVVDPPLDTEAVREYLPAEVELLAVVETGVPAWRAAGGRLLAGASGAPLFGGAGVALRPGTRIPGFPEAGVVAAPARAGREVALVAGDVLAVGDLDAQAAASDSEAAARVDASRADLADRFPDARAIGSGGDRAGADLAGLATPPIGPLVNAEALRMTNEGKSDLYWADPRFRAPAPPVDRDYLGTRSGSPWSPTVLDLGGVDAPADALRLAPERLASEIGGLEAAREVVVLAADPGTAETAAGFLRRLGFSATWLR